MAALFINTNITIMSIIGGLVSGILGAGVNYSVNKANAAQQQKYTQANMILQNKMNRDNFLTEHEYNVSDILASHSREVSSRKAAGLSSVEEAAQAAQTPDASIASGGAPQGASIAPTDFSSYLQNAVQMFLSTSQSKKNLADAENTHTETKLKETELLTMFKKNMVEIDNLVKHGIISDEEAKGMRLDNQFKIDTYENRVNMAELDEELKRKQNDIAESRKKIEETNVSIAKLSEALSRKQLTKLQNEIEYQIPMLKAQLNKVVAETFAASSQGKLNLASAKAAMAQAALLGSQKFGQDILNALNREKIPYAAEMAQLMTEKCEQELDLGLQYLFVAQNNTAMSNFERSHQSWTYWSNQATNWVNSAANMVKAFIPFSGAAANVQPIQPTAGNGGPMYVPPRWNTTTWMFDR